MIPSLPLSVIETVGDFCRNIQLDPEFMLVGAMPHLAHPASTDPSKRCPGALSPGVPGHCLSPSPPSLLHCHINGGPVVRHGTGESHPAGMPAVALSKPALSAASLILREICLSESPKTDCLGNGSSGRMASRAAIPIGVIATTSGSPVRFVLDLSMRSLPEPSGQFSTSSQVIAAASERLSPASLKRRHRAISILPRRTALSLASAALRGPLPREHGSSPYGVQASGRSAAACFCGLERVLIPFRVSETTPSRPGFS